MTEELTHAEHVDVEAWPLDCIEGDCEHGSGDDYDMRSCPSVEFSVCIDCMVENERGTDPEFWDDLPLLPWPHPGSAGWTETPPPASHGPEPEPPILEQPRHQDSRSRGPSP